jgi:hypothetical protein
MKPVLNALHRHVYIRLISELPLQAGSGEASLQSTLLASSFVAWTLLRGAFLQNMTVSPSEDGSCVVTGGYWLVDRSFLESQPAEVERPIRSTPVSATLRDLQNFPFGKHPAGCRLPHVTSGRRQQS